MSDEESAARTSAAEEAPPSTAEQLEAAPSAASVADDADEAATPDFNIGRLPTPTKPDGTKLQRKDMARVRVLKKHRPERDSLSLAEGEVLFVRSKDGMGWAEGEKEDGEVGWFPLDKVEEFHDNPIGEVGTVPEKSALDHFISEVSSKKPSKTLEARVRAASAADENKLKKRDSLRSLLETRPMREQLVDKNILASEEATASVIAAQKRLEKTQKKKKKTAADVILERLNHGDVEKKRKYSHDNDKVDEAILTLSELPRKKQMYHLTSYEDTVTGTTILHHIETEEKFKAAFTYNGKPDDAKNVGQLLVDWAVIVEASGVKPKFDKKYLYHIHFMDTEYSVVNLDKIWQGSGGSGYDVSLELAREVIEATRSSLPNPQDLRGTETQRRIGLHLSRLQKVDIDGLSDMQKHIMWLNIFTTMVLYTHMKFSPPMTMIDRKYLTENCYLRIANETLSLSDIEAKALEAASKANWQVFLCMSDCTVTSPATYLWTEENFDITRTHAVRYFLTKHTDFDAGDYTVTFPKLCQRIWKELEFENKTDLLDILMPMLPADVRAEYEKASQGGTFDVKFATSSHDPMYAFEEEAVLSPR